MHAGSLLTTSQNAIGVRNPGTHVSEGKGILDGVISQPLMMGGGGDTRVQSVDVKYVDDGVHMGSGVQRTGVKIGKDRDGKLRVRHRAPRTDKGNTSMAILNIASKMDRKP